MTDRKSIPLMEEGVIRNHLYLEKQIHFVMKEKKKLFIHIGTPKAGSTSIQLFLNNNFKVLRDNGYYFPKYKIYKDSWDHYFSKYLQKLMIIHHNEIEAELYPFISDAHFSDATKNIEYYEKKFINKFQKEILSKNSNIIISNESFFIYDTIKFRKIMELLNKAILDYKDNFVINIIIYFRKQDSFIESFYYMSGKYIYFSTDFQRYLRQFKPFAKNDNKISLNWPDFIDIINETQPYAKVIVRSFDSAIQSGLIQDFCEVIGLNDIPCKYEEIHENLRFNKLGMDLMLNSGFLNIKDKEVLFRAIRGDDLFTKSLNSQKYKLLTDSQRKEIYDTYKESNMNLFGFSEDEYIKLFYPNNNQTFNSNLPEEERAIIIKKIVKLKKKTLEYRVIQMRRVTLDKLPPGLRMNITRLLLPVWQIAVKIYWNIIPK
ncbi:MAG: hypothetical protein ACXQTN_03305 [Methanoculleaceae archaeon]